MSNKAVAAAQEEEDAGFEVTSEAPLDSRLALIPGLDAAKGLKHLRGRVDSYAKLLKTFAHTRNADMEAMRAHLAARDFAQLATVAHNIQGAAGFLGATRISALAAEITAAQRCGGDGEEIAAVALDLIEAQAELAAAVQTQFGDSPLPTP